MSRNRIVLISVLAVLVLLAGSCVMVVIGSYHAAPEAAAAMVSQNGVTVTQPLDSVILFAADGATSGVVFYPGGLVDFDAYVPMCRAIADHGVSAALVRMPGNFAFMDMDAALRVPALLPEVEHWYIAGHSLGGVMGGSCAAKHPERFDGVILLASYVTDNLTSTRVLSVYGTQDGVLNHNRYAQYRANLPADLTEVVIPGGCHSFFGNYGMQKGDGTPTLTRDMQQLLTAEAIAAFVLN